jgi:hypothetical protein
MYIRVKSGVEYAIVALRQANVKHDFFFLDDCRMIYYASFATTNVLLVKLDFNMVQTLAIPTMRFVESTFSVGNV